MKRISLSVTTAAMLVGILSVAPSATAGFYVIGGSGRAKGDAEVGDVLSGKTFSNETAKGITGAMPNHGAVTITPSTTDQTIEEGYHNGSGGVAGDTDLAAGNIKKDVEIFGVIGTFDAIDTSNATAGAADIKDGQTAYVDGSLVTGSMPDKSGTNITPGASDKTIPDGYHNGSTVAGDAELVPGNIRKNVTIFGVTGSDTVVDTSTGDAAAGEILVDKKAWVNGTEVTGTMPNRAAVTITPSTTDQTISAGYYNSSGTVEGDADLVSGNIRKDVTIFGVTGSDTVVDTSTGDALGEDILADKTAWVDGVIISGTMPNHTAVTITPSTTDQVIVKGYHNGDGKVLGEEQLVPENIKNGVTVFGVEGSLLSARPPQTGQTECSTGSGDSWSWAPYCDSAVPAGQDGELLNGVELPTPRFIVNDDGTVTDKLTGLVWLRDANCTIFYENDITGSNNRLWEEAMSAANQLADGYCDLSDGSSAGDWRLPNIRELHSLVNFAAYNEPPPPAISNTAGTERWTDGDPFFNIREHKDITYSTNYWSSTTTGFYPGYTWVVNFRYGNVNFYSKMKGYVSDPVNPDDRVVYVWPVRDKK